MDPPISNTRFTLGFIAGCYLFFPLAFFYLASVRQFMIFGSYLYWPFHDYTDPVSYGLPHAKNYYVNSVGDVRLGVWYIPPKGIWEKLAHGPKEREPSKWTLDDNRPVIIYYHGHAQCRACDYRVGLYKTLSQSDRLDAHVFAFDYRGFGDSTSVLPDRRAIIHDSLIIYDHVRKLVNLNDQRILLWGHSLGTAVVAQLSEAMPEVKRAPMGIVFEAPFSSLYEAAIAWPIAKLYYFYPAFRTFMKVLYEDENTFFETEEIIHTNKFPALIIHSPDDALIAFEMGQTLYSVMKEVCDAPVHFYKANDAYSLGHRYIFKDPKVQKAVAEFISSVSNVDLPPAPVSLDFDDSDEPLTESGQESITEKSAGEAEESISESTKLYSREYAEDEL